MVETAEQRAERLTGFAEWAPVSAYPAGRDVWLHSIMRPAGTRARIIKHLPDGFTRLRIFPMTDGGLAFEEPYVTEVESLHLARPRDR